MNGNYLESALKQFAYYKMLGDKTFAQLTEEQLHWKINEDSNSIAIIVKHLWGNMLSRWTDFLTSDGEKDWRNRDAEFEIDIQSKEALLEKWEAGWKVLLNTVRSLKEADLAREIFIRNQGHSVVEAINRQLTHYAYHVGQIVFIGKMVCGSTWQSLSIPKHGSEIYNAEKFAEEKGTKHFTDDYLDDETSK